MSNLKSYTSLKDFVDMLKKISSQNNQTNSKFRICNFCQYSNGQFKDVDQKDQWNCVIIREIMWEISLIDLINVLEGLTKINPKAAVLIPNKDGYNIPLDINNVNIRAKQITYLEYVNNSNEYRLEDTTFILENSDKATVLLNILNNLNIKEYETVQALTKEICPKLDGHIGLYDSKWTTSANLQKQLNIDVNRIKRNGFNFQILDPEVAKPPYHNMVLHIVKLLNDNRIQTLEIAVALVKEKLSDYTLKPDYLIVFYDSKWYIQKDLFEINPRIDKSKLHLYSPTIYEYKA